MSTEETKTIVLKMVQSGNVDGDVDAAIAAYDPDFTYHNAVMKDMPPFEHTTDAVRQLIEATRTAFPDMRYTIDGTVTCGCTRRSKPASTMAEYKSWERTVPSGDAASPSPSAVLTAS